MCALQLAQHTPSHTGAPAWPRHQSPRCGTRCAHTSRPAALLSPALSRPVCFVTGWEQQPPAGEESAPVTAAVTVRAVLCCADRLCVSEWSGGASCWPRGRVCAHIQQHTHIRSLRRLQYCSSLPEARPATGRQACGVLAGFCMHAVDGGPAAFLPTCSSPRSSSRCFRSALCCCCCALCKRRTKTHMQGTSRGRPRC